MKKKILVVDDEQEICDFLKVFFEDRSFQVKTLRSGEEVMETVNAWTPHVVLLDIKMPGMDGLSVLKQIKQEHSMIKVIMVTAVETRDKIEEAMRSGADNYITKPLSLEYLERDVQDKITHLFSVIGAH